MESATDCAIFSLFHHNVYSLCDIFSFDTENLHKLSENPPEYEVTDLANIIFKIIVDNISQYRDSEISLTLTGGMDSRLILACLLKAGVKPNCLVYGNIQSKDVIFSNQIAKAFGLEIHNPIQDAPSSEWYYKWVVETIKRDKGNSGLHRAHRTAAIAEHTQLYSPKVLFTGHMGGEGLRGLTYNDYFASDFFRLVNEGISTPKDAAVRVLQNYFLKISEDQIENILEQVSKMTWMKENKNINKFYFLYDLIAKVHHSQDIRLFSSFVPRVVPVYLQPDYLKILFRTRYHLLKKNDGIFSRLNNPLVYCNILQKIYPALINFPLSNGYTPAEYLKGFWYFIPVKIFRDYRRTKYQPSFYYGKWFIDFIKESSNNINEDIWEIYDQNIYKKSLNSCHHKTNEGYWFKFSAPIYFDMIEKFRKGLL